MKRAPTEAELAAVVVAWFEALGADVYSEVDVGGGIADIVARRGPELTIVETKTSWSLSLITQALDRRRCAHRVYIAAPYTRNQRDVAELCRELGVGLLEVRVGEPDLGIEPHVLEVVTSRRWNRRPLKLAARLRPEHKTSAPAGHAGGGRWTPFRDTCQQLRRLVEAEPGITLKAAIDRTTHHYSSSASARGAMLRWIEGGKVDGVSLLRGRVTTLHPTRKS